MQEQLTDETVKEIGLLAKLQITEENIAVIRSDMQQMLERISILKEADTQAIAEADLLPRKECFLREDAVTESNLAKAIFAQAIEQAGDFFAVPHTFS